MTVQLARRRPQPQPHSLALAPVKGPERLPDLPGPSQLARELEFSSAATYRRAVDLAFMHLEQTRRVLAHRQSQLERASARAEKEQAETTRTYTRQLHTIESRYAAWVREAHARHAGARAEAARPRLEAEAALAEACAAAGPWGALRLEARRLDEARALARELGHLAKRTLGLGGLGDWRAFSSGVRLHAREAEARRSPETAALLDALLQAVMRTHAVQARAKGPDHARALVAEMKALNAPELAALWRLREADAYFTAGLGRVFAEVTRWLRGAEPGAAEAALDRLRLDVEMLARQSARSLKAALALTPPAEPEAAAAVSSALQALAEAERLESGLAQAAAAALQHDLSYLDGEREKGSRLADALVVGMDHTAGRALADARSRLQHARDLETAWLREIQALEQAPSGWERFAWRAWRGLDLDAFWEGRRQGL